MGRISSLLLVVAVLELLETLLVGGRLSLLEGPGTRQSENTETRGSQMAVPGGSQGSANGSFTFAGERSGGGGLHHWRAVVLKVRFSRELF